MHANDLSYTSKPEDEIKKYDKGDEIEVKIIEIKSKDQKLKLSVKNLKTDPFDIFKDKKVNDIITVKVKSTSPKGIIVCPEENDFEIQIKKNQIKHKCEKMREVIVSYRVIGSMLRYAN